MAERKILFSLDLERFRQIWDTDDWFNLQREFKNNNVPLSNSLLKWLDENIPYFADFENTKTYDIHEKVGEDPENPIAEVWERGNEEEQPVTSKNSEYILSRLLSAQGTNRGFIDFSKRINLDELELEQLKRSDLLGAGFSFELAHQDLLIVHGMLREIMATPREWLLNFSLRIIRDVVCQRLRQFYEMAQKIVEFEIVGENPKQTHDKLIGEITQFCDQVKEALRPIIAFLSSRKVDQLAAEVNSTVTAAVDRLETENNRAKENNNAARRSKQKCKRNFSTSNRKCRTNWRNSQFRSTKALFGNQAEIIGKGSDLAWNGGVATARVRGSFILLPTQHFWNLVAIDLNGKSCKISLPKDSTFSDLRVA